MKDNRTVLLVTLAMVIAMTVAGFVCYQRTGIEKNNNAVEVTVDHNDIERLSMFTNISIKDLLMKLRDAGVTSVAVSEDLANDTDINILAGVDPKKLNLYIKSRGLSNDKIRSVRESGLRVIPRIRNFFNLESGSINKKITDLEGLDTVVFSEEEVLGYPSYLKETASALRSQNIKYGFIEFGKQLGDIGLASYSGSNIVKVHSIAVDEMEKLSEQEMVDRFLRAAKERSIRMLYVHLLAYPDKGRDLLQTNISFIGKIINTLRSNGFSVGKASSPEEMSVGRAVRVLIGLGVAGGCILLASCFISMNLFFVLAMLIAICAIPSAKALALLSAIVFPSYAVISQFPAKRENVNIGLISRSMSIVTYIAAITALGGVFIAALLSGSKYMLGVDSFVGVKLAFILPIFVVAAYFFLRPDEGERTDLKRSVLKITDLLAMNVTIFHVISFVIIAAAAAILILRSGNFGLPVPTLEKFLRGTLENILVVRPRTKEFLIGYPAIVLAAMYYIKGGNKWLWLLLSAGVLAPISLTNSFCHIHTPLNVTVTRSCVGLILGAAIGLLLYMFYAIFIKLMRLINK